MHLRLLVPADAPAFRALRLRGLREHPEAFTSSFEEDERQPLEATVRRLDSGRESFWGAFEQGELCGIAGLQRQPRAKSRHKATIVGMYVAPEQAGKGLGQALLAAALDAARAEGLGLLVLTVTEGNAAAQRLYERTGFRSFGVEPGAIRVGPRRYAKNHMYLELDAP